MEPVRVEEQGHIELRERKRCKRPCVDEEEEKEPEMKVTGYKVPERVVVEEE